MLNWNLISRDGLPSGRGKYLIKRNVRNGSQERYLLCSFIPYKYYELSKKYEGGNFSPSQSNIKLDQKDITHWAEIIPPDEEKPKLSFTYWSEDKRRYYTWEEKKKK